MNTTPFQYHRPGVIHEPGFDELSQSEPLIEHLTVPGFLSRVPRQWQIDEATRFGHQLGRAAEAMHLAYMTTTDRALGVIRVFPVPLMRRVYTLMGQQFGWPALPETLEAPKTAQQDDRVARHLQTLLATAPDAVVREHIVGILRWLDEGRK